MPNIQDLIQSFRIGNLFSTGDLSVWADTLGKPGDNFFHLTSIDYHESIDRLIFTFGEYNKIQIDRPAGIMIEKDYITVSQAKKILWENEFSKVEYIFFEGKVNANVLTGSKICRINETAPAFVFFTW